MGRSPDNTSGSAYGYRMSKVALSMADKSLAHDLKPRGIAVEVLHPGWLQTQITNFIARGITPETSVKGLLARMDAFAGDDGHVLARQWRRFAVVKAYPHGSGTPDSTCLLALQHF